MAVEFTSEHVVGVVVFVLALMCCKSILECIQAALVLFKDCSCFCDYNCGYHFFLYGKTALLFFNAIQPVIMCLAGAFRAAVTGEQPRSRVFVVALSLNTSTFLAHESTQAVAATLSFQSVDLLFSAIPFSMLACLSTAAWMNLAKANLFDSDPVWDEGLFQHDERIWIYETLYYAELFGMCVALLAAASVPQPSATLLYMSTSVTALLVVFTFAARYPNHSQAGLCITSTTFALLCAMTSTFAFTALDTGCAWSVLCGATFVCTVMAIAIFHHIAAGSMPAGSIILARTVLSNTCSLVLIATLAAGRTSSC
jgi:hypothetical protein